MKLNRDRMIEILTDFYKNNKDDGRYVLAVDFDNTLCYSKYPECGKPTPVASFLRSVQDLNMIIILNTCREGKPLVKALEWSDKQGLRFDYVNEHDEDRIVNFPIESRKIFCHMLIDDTSYGFNMKDFI